MKPLSSGVQRESVKDRRKPQTWCYTGKRWFYSSWSITECRNKGVKAHRHKTHSRKPTQHSKAYSSIVIHTAYHNIGQLYIGYFEQFKQLFGSVTGNELPSVTESGLSGEEAGSGPMIPSHRCHLVPCLTEIPNGSRGVQTTCQSVCVQEQRELFLSAWWESPIGASQMS